MDLLEKINRSLGNLYDSLFGAGDVRPKDVLRRLLTSLEEYREEGLDGRIYVPNQYILEIEPGDEEEKEYLLSFLDRSELESAIRRYCEQNEYLIRGTLDFTIREAEQKSLPGQRGEKVRIVCRYASKSAQSAIPPPAPASLPARPILPVEERTVPGVGIYTGEEGGTVPSIAAATLTISAPDKPTFSYDIAQGSVTIGRSAKAGNDIVIEHDGQISKRHARIELDPDGRFTLYDLDSTNGVRVNGKRVDNTTLNDGDEVLLGVTRIQFRQHREEEISPAQPAPREDRELAGATSARDAEERFAGRSMGAFGGGRRQKPDEIYNPTPPARVLRIRNARLILIEQGQEIEDYVLATETLIGRGVTNDIVLPDRSVAVRHARIVSDGDVTTLEVLEPAAVTRHNGIEVRPNQAIRLRHGDVLHLGNREVHFHAN